MTENHKPDKARSTGSLPNSEPVFLAVGKLRRPHGVHGEMVMEVWTDFPERLSPGSWLYIGSEHQAHKLVKTRGHKNDLLVSLEGYATPEAVGMLRNLIVYVSAESRPDLPEGEFYHHQLIGLKVISDQGVHLGRVRDILETGANDVLVIQAENRSEILVPFIDELLIRVDLATGEIHLRLMKGLLPEDQE